jgi:monoterpene epsilon-lactone hydrolase
MLRDVQVSMPRWQDNFSARLTGLAKPRGAIARGSLDELRQRYDLISAQFGQVPADAEFEHAQLGQVRGEWLYVPESEPQRLLLYFHGGGYISGSPETHRPLVAKLCKATGAAALVVNYRLGPEFPYPAALRDAVDAYRFLIGNGFSAQSIVFAGEGSGGGLVFATIMAARNAGLAMPAACVAMSPWADLTLSGWSYLENARKDEFLNWEFLFASARYYLQKAKPSDMYASPIYGSFHDLPPVMVHAGSLEVLRDDASKIGELAAAAAIPVSVEVYDGMHHVFQAHPGASEARVSLGRIGQFVRKHTPQSASVRAVTAGAAVSGGKKSRNGL